MSRVQKQSKRREELLGELMHSEKDLSRISVMFRSAIANQFGLNVSDAECMDYLMDVGPVTAGKLADITGLTHGAITNVIDRLEKAGFVKRQSDPKDRRKVIVVPVQENTDAMAEVYLPTVMKIFQLYSSYSDADLDFLLRFYREMMRIYEEGTRYLTSPHSS